MSIDICPHCGDYYDQDWNVEHPDECGENPEVMKQEEDDNSLERHPDDQ